MSSPMAAEEASQHLPIVSALCLVLSRIKSGCSFVGGVRQIRGQSEENVIALHTITVEREKATQ